MDALPSHVWNRWRYHYPQAAYPYQDLIDQNAARNRFQPEYELVDSGVFDRGRYWIVEVHYAKADPDDLLMKVSVTNSGPDTDRLHVLPTAWFRNTWSWDSETPRPRMGVMDDNGVGIEHPWLGRLELLADADPDGGAPAVLFCENESNLTRLHGVEPITAVLDDRHPGDRQALSGLSCPVRPCGAPEHSYRIGSARAGAIRIDSRRKTKPDKNQVQYQPPVSKPSP